MQIIDCKQGEPEWFAARIGVATASNFSKVLAKGQGVTRSRYLMQLLAEVATGQKADSYTSAQMQWGIDNEPEARQAYEMMFDVDVQQVGFCKHSARIGASPDGLVGDRGLLEIKCPDTVTHLETIFSGKAPTEYKAQMQGQIWVCERDWCDFVSYDPRVVNGNPFFCVRVNRDEEYIKTLDAEVNRFVEELEALIARLNPELKAA